MRMLAFTSFALLTVSQWRVLAQSAPAAESGKQQPLYEVTIVFRTTKALNYGYLTAPTRIDFRAHQLPQMRAARRSRGKARLNAAEAEVSRVYRHQTSSDHSY